MMLQAGQTGSTILQPGDTGGVTTYPLAAGTPQERSRCVAEQGHPGKRHLLPPPALPTLT